jgi:UDP:flavonoid glycosyltransferase YjiC (YdhE family)
MFSRWLAAPQPDWPASAVATGFLCFDDDGPDGLPPELARFLEAGPPPVVFTLGSSAVHDPGRFYEHGAEAARRLGLRSVLLVGREPRWKPSALPQDCAVFDYAPYSQLFPRCAAIVHQGGVGTTAQCLRAGKPMLVMPFSHDQPDNAARVTRLGLARTLPRSASVRRMTRDLHSLLSDPGFAARAASIGEKVRAEDGAATAVAAIERAAANVPCRDRHAPAWP